MGIEEIKTGFPDCIGRRFTGKGWERVRMEFEFRSSSFKRHRHDPNECDIIVCWEHDWKDCPIEVLELRELIKTLPNPELERPDKATAPGDLTIEELLEKYPEKVGKLFHKLAAKVKRISDEIWYKSTKRGATFYSPNRVFIYVKLQKRGLSLTIFTRGTKLPSVKPFEYEKAAAKWGRLRITEEKQITQLIPVLRKSHELIQEAIRNNEPTGWYASLDNESED